jgi:acetyl-CoA carboxylase biotin carboxyl carrier protein
MNPSSNSNQDIFDVRKIRRLVELMKEHDLCEIDLQQGDVKIQLRRSNAGVIGGAVGAAPVVYAAPAPVVSAGTQPSQAAAAPAGAGSDASDHTVLIKSPMVGTFYSSPDPESPPYVKVGDHVGAETTVCIVEAMKVFNQIPAEISGRIVSVLVESGESVEFGQPLFKVDAREQ